MIVVVAVVVAVLLAFARRHRFTPVMRLLDQWERLRPFVTSYVRASPGTFVYLAILSITTMVMVTSSNEVVSLLLEEHSTNLRELFSNPGRVLVLSPFWAPNYEFLVWAILFALVLAPAERWLGTARWMSVFFTGHVLATLGVAWGLWLAIRHGYASRHLESAIDVGVSYGFAAVAAVFSYRLPRHWRGAWIVMLIGITGVAFIVGRSFTDAGHLLAVVIGFGCYPWTRGAGPRARGTGPIWSAWSSPRDEPAVE